jgi:hypothetical protein
VPAQVAGRRLEGQDAAVSHTREIGVGGNDKPAFDYRTEDNGAGANRTAHPRWVTGRDVERVDTPGRGTGVDDA